MPHQSNCPQNIEPSHAAIRLHPHRIKPKIRWKMPIFRVEPTGTRRENLRIVGLQARHVTARPGGPGEYPPKAYPQPCKGGIRIPVACQKGPENKVKQGKTNRNKPHCRGRSTGLPARPSSIMLVSPKPLAAAEILYPISGPQVVKAGQAFQLGLPQLPSIIDPE
jgi:hypothetical protein